MLIDPPAWEALLMSIGNYFGDLFPDHYYRSLLRDGAVATTLYFGDSAQGTEDEYWAAFGEPLAALAIEDGLRVQVADQNYTGWWAPFVILTKPDGSHFPYPPHEGSGSDEHREWLCRVERKLGRTLEEARLRRGVELPAKTRLFIR
jgi:hypothetical protein